jgi:predicted enzyme related to lactoylglutathione lyase
MTQSDHDRQVDYIEFGASDVGRTREFYQQVFGWRFQDYGPDYTSFQDGRLSGGFTKDASVRPANPLVVIYAVQLEAIEAKIEPVFAAAVARLRRALELLEKRY